MMSKRCKYALKALVQLGKNYHKGNLVAEEIAAAGNIPKKFLEIILLELKRAGYVRSKPGLGGGYHLAQTPNKISLAEIYRLFDGAIALQPCVSQKFRGKCDDCPDENACDLREAFAEIREKTFEVMSRITLASLLHPAPKAKARAR
jgi:Rrf2 family protein